MRVRGRGKGKERDTISQLILLFSIEEFTINGSKDILGRGKGQKAHKMVVTFNHFYVIRFHKKKIHELPTIVMLIVNNIHYSTPLYFPSYLSSILDSILMDSSSTSINIRIPKSISFNVSPNQLQGSIEDLSCKKPYLIYYLNYPHILMKNVVNLAKLNSGTRNTLHPKLITAKN